MLSTEGIHRANVGVPKTPNRTLSVTDTIAEDIMSPERKEATMWINSWHHIDQEEKRLLVEDKEKLFNNILDL